MLIAKMFKIVYLDSLHYTIFLCSLFIRFTYGVSIDDPAKTIESNQEKRIELEHRSDSVTLLAYIGLLILTVLTIWLFKHRRIRFIHETGMSVIYGMIVGAIIRYGYRPGTTSKETVMLPLKYNSSVITKQMAPERLVLNIPIEEKFNNRSLRYEYSFHGQIKDLADNDVVDEKATFNPELFFNIILPPIIFNAGYSMKRRHFFRNFGAIIIFAFLGTAISCVVVGAVVYGGIMVAGGTLVAGMQFADCLFFGALISATDPVTVLAIFNDLNVDVDLYAIVFGESVLNDAVAIVLTQSIEKYGKMAHGGVDGMAILSAIGNFLAIFFGAFSIGAAMGCLTALMTKYTHVRDHPLLECALFFLMSYSTFLAAEASGFTGIVAVLFCGITQAHYTFNNLSSESKTRTKQLFELLNFLSENFVFAYIGVSAFTFRQHVADGAFISFSFLGILLGRAIHVYPLTFFLNLGRRNKITLNKQHMMMFSGLRGAIAFALSIRNTSSDGRRAMFTTTLIVVIVTVILCGGFTTQMLQWLRIKVGVEDDTGQEMKNMDAVRTDRSLSQSSKRDAGTSSRSYGRAFILRTWNNIDSRFLKPLLTHSRPLLIETLPRCCLPLAQILTTEEQMKQTVSSLHEVDTNDLEDLILREDEFYLGRTVQQQSEEKKSGNESNQQKPSDPIPLPLVIDIDRNGTSSKTPWTEFSNEEQMT